MMLKHFRRLLLVLIISAFACSFIGCGCFGPEPPPPIVEPPPPPPPPRVTPPRPPEPDKPEATTPTEPPKAPEPKVEPMPPTPTAPPEAPEPEPQEIEKLDAVYFDYDKSNIRPDAEDTLTHNASWLKKDENKDVRILIEGHCDERGTDEYNMALGDRRANSAKKFLVKMGIDSGRFDTISYGESRPAKEGHNESAWRWNRRAEFIIK